MIGDRTSPSQKAAWRSAYDGRRVLNGIFWVFSSGAPWRDLPERYERVQTDGGDYSMNHNASVFLFDATGRFATMIDYHDPRDFAVPKIRRAMNDNERN